VRVRLLLVGDDDALDVLAELSRHLPLFELVRIDDLGDRDLGADDVVVIGANSRQAREALLRDAMSRGAARHVAVLANAVHAEDAGRRAILVAAEIVRALDPGASG